jgi:hypothetical protein
MQRYAKPSRPKGRTRSIRVHSAMFIMSNQESVGEGRGLGYPSPLMLRGICDISDCVYSGDRGRPAKLA